LQRPLLLLGPRFRGDDDDNDKTFQVSCITLEPSLGVLYSRKTERRHRDKLAGITIDVPFLFLTEYTLLP
jgi:hypothetical protein